MTDKAREVLDGIRTQSDGLTDLCPEHLRQSIRHVQRNCDIDCNTHEDDYDECKQPDRYDGERMANALSAIPRLTAALEAVLAQAESRAATLRATADRLNQQVIDRDPDRDYDAAIRYDHYAIGAEASLNHLRTAIDKALTD